MSTLHEFKIHGDFTAGGASGKEPSCQGKVDIRDADLIPGLGRSPGEGDGNPLQYCLLENPMDRAAWRAQSMRLHRVGTTEAT